MSTAAIAPAKRSYLNLFLISFILLFFELACIRWFGSTVVFLTFFTNIRDYDDGCGCLARCAR